MANDDLDDYIDDMYQFLATPEIIYTNEVTLRNLVGDEKVDEGFKSGLITYMDNYSGAIQISKLTKE